MTLVWLAVLFAAKFLKVEFDPLFWWLLLPLLFQDMYDNQQIKALREDVDRLQRAVQGQAARIIYPR